MQQASLYQAGDTGSDISAKRAEVLCRDEEPGMVRESARRTEREKGDVPARKQGRENSGIP